MLGVPRGATTWVGRLLGRTAGSVYVHEPDGTADPFAFRAKLHHHHHPILSPGAEAPELARLWDGAFAGGGLSRTPRDRVARRAYKGVTGAQKGAARSGGRFTPRLRLAYLAAEPRVAVDAENVVVKTVTGALCAEWIVERWQPRVVVVSRDPRNVISSWIDLGWNTPRGPIYRALADLAADRWGVSIPPIDAPPIERAAAVCATLMVALRDGLRLHPDWLHVIHEDLCEDPVAGFRSAAAALGLRWSEDAEELLAASNRPGERYATQRVAAEQPERGRRRLTADQVDAIAEVLDRFPAELWETSPRDAAHDTTA